MIREGGGREKELGKEEEERWKRGGHKEKWRKRRERKRGNGNGKRRLKGKERTGKAYPGQ